MAAAVRDKVLANVRQLDRQVAVHRAAGRRVVFTNGCFDVLHRGHVEYLAAARALGDVLVVAVNSDKSVRRLKGSGRPVNPEGDRALVLAALASVDHVVVFREDTPLALVERVRPDVYAKGGDYRPDTLPEAPAVIGYGGQVSILPFVAGRSTTALIAQLSTGAPGTPPGTPPVAPPEVREG